MLAACEQMDADSALEFQLFYSASSFRRSLRPEVSRLLCEQLILSGLRPTPDAPHQCVRLACQHPLETAMGLRKLLEGTWVQSRVDSLAIRDPKEAARRIVGFQPTRVVPRRAKVTTVLANLAPEVANQVKAYWRALADIPDLDTPPEEELAPALTTMFLSIVREVVA